jgi:diguanylate cyclase (GGDEF)-like protein/PAS domain S-box-containing protein
MWRYTQHDRAPDPALDEMTRLASAFFSVPVVMVSLVDEGCQWFKSHVGVESSETSRDVSFCAHAILGEGLFEVRDASSDPRFCENPLVVGPPHARYYLGAPLVTPEGLSIGTLCILDTAPRHLNDADKRHLMAMARQVMRHLELRRLERLEQSVCDAGMGVWELDVPSDAVWGNAEFQRLHGRGVRGAGSRDEFAKDYLPDDRIRLQAGLRRVIQAGQPFEACLRLQRRGDDEVTWVQLTAASVDGTLPSRHLAGTLQDITALKSKSRELQWRHQIDQLVTRLQAGFIAGDDIPGAFAEALQALLDFTGSEYGFIGEVFRNDQGRPYLKTHAITDISWDETSRAFYKQASPDGLVFTRLDSLYGHVLTTGQPLISNDPGNDSRCGGLPPGHPPLRSLLCLPVRLEEEVVAMLGIANRRSGYDEASLALLEPLLMPLAQLVHGLRLRRQHDAAWERLELSAKVFSSSREAIMISDAENRIIEVNEAFERITGYAREEVLGQNPRILSSGRQAPAFYQRLWQALDAEGFWQGEILDRRKNGELLPGMFSISVVRNDAGEATHHVAVFSDLTRIKQHADELFRAGHFDRLTALPNRFHMIELMHQVLERRRKSETLAVAVLDLDAFQDLNALVGREVADRVLVAVAGRFAEVVNPGDVVARLGGDEFGFLLDRFQGGPERLERILSSLSEPLMVEGVAAGVSVTGSLGVTLYPSDDADPETLLRHADQAMYRAKVLGGNTFMLFDPRREQEIKALQSRRQEVSRALLNEEFVLYYQPQVDPHLGCLVGAEALIRWRHPVQGLLPPAAFLPAIEGSDLEPAFDAWVLRTGLCQLEEWLDQGFSPTVCLNLTPQSLMQESFVKILRGELAAHPGVAPQLVCLEVLESAALEDIQLATRVMRQCRELGVQVALDDFGTGYSSLAYLRDLPVDVVKVDRSFVMAMLESDHDLAIVESVVYLAHRFSKQVVAEGVESDAHVQRLKTLGCDLLQGFGIARPMPAEALLEWGRQYRGQ